MSRLQPRSKNTWLPRHAPQGRRRNESRAADSQASCRQMEYARSCLPPGGFLTPFWQIAKQIIALTNLH